MLPREGLNFNDLNQSAHPCLSAKNEDSSKTENRSWKELHAWRMFAAIFKLGKRHQEVLMTNYTLSLRF